MSRGQRLPPTSQQRGRRLRNVNISPSNEPRVVGRTWKEEREIYKALLVSIRDRSNPTPTNKRPKRSRTCETSSSSTGDGGISTSPHPRKSRPLPGSLSHQFLISSSFSRSYFSLLSQSRRSLARATANAIATAREVKPSPAATATAETPDKQLPRKKGRKPKSVVEVITSKSPKARDEEPFEKFEAEHLTRRRPRAGFPRSPDIKEEQKSENGIKTLAETNDNGDVKYQPQSPAADLTKLCGSRVPHLPPELWQDRNGNPVNTHTFVDFLCFHGTPCMTEELAWFAKPPFEREFANHVSGGRRVLPVLTKAEKSGRTAGTGLGRRCGFYAARKTASNVKHLFPPSPTPSHHLTQRISPSSPASPRPISDIGVESRIRAQDSDDKEFASKSRTGQSIRDAKSIQIKVEKPSPPLWTRSRGKEKKAVACSPLALRKASPRPQTTHSPLSRRRSGLRSQALLRTRRQQRLRRR